MSWLAASLRAHPELALGDGVARIRVGAFQVNLIISVLLAGVLKGISA
jgi:hypothetical protein